MRATIVFSGGMDSTTVAYYYHKKGYELTLVTFDYGQRHKKEIQFAKITAERLGAQHEIIDISGIKCLLKGSSLTDDIDVPTGHYEEESMSVTVVPNRNAIMASLAYGIASCNGSDIVAMGIHKGDHHIYPDCREDFLESMNKSMRLATRGHRHDDLKLEAPFVKVSKTDIVRLGTELGVDYAETWTCYKGLDIHCGECGACQERKESFIDNGLVDPTEYES